MSSSSSVGAYFSPFQQKISSAKSEIVNGERTVTVNFFPFTAIEREYLTKVAEVNGNFLSQMARVDAQIKELAMEHMRMKNEMFDSFQQSHEFLGFAVKNTESGTSATFRAFTDGFLDFKREYIKFLEQNDREKAKEFKANFDRDYKSIRDRFLKNFYYN